MKLQKIVLFFFSGLFTLVSSDVYYVTPSSSVPCAEKESPCLTLSQYAEQPSNYFASNTTLILLPGNHRLQGNLSFFTDTMKYIAILASDAIDTPTVYCQLLSPIEFSFLFRGVNQIVFSGLTFVGCMGDIQSVPDFVIDNCTFADGSYLILSINKSEVVFHNSFVKDNIATSFNALVQCSNSQITFNKSIISNNSMDESSSFVRCLDHSNLTFISASFYDNYGDALSMSELAMLTAYDTNLIIKNSTFCNNFCIHLVNSYASNSVQSPHVLHIHSSVFIQNSCPDIVYTMIITNVELSVNDTSFIENGFKLVCGEYRCDVHSILSYIMTGGDEDTTCANHSLVIRNSLFKSNFDTDMLFVYMNCPLTAVIENTIFEHNKITIIDDVTMLSLKSLISVYMEPPPTTDLLNSLVTVNDCAFYNNSCTGAIDIRNFPQNATITVIAVFHNTSFSHNKLNNKLSTWIFVERVYFVEVNSITFAHNQGKLFHSLDSNVHLTNSKFSDNFGSFSTSNSNVTFLGLTIFDHNYAVNNLNQGGALTCFQSDIAFFDYGILANNYAAFHGGGILATECRINVIGILAISNNTANISGGGIFAIQSEINIRGENVEIRNNQAGVNGSGGGLYATGSTIKLFKNSLMIENNTAGKRGGGCYLENNARLYVIKSRCEDLDDDDNDEDDMWLHLKFSNNSAYFGGAVYVDDKTGLCAETDASQSPDNNWCFLQVLSTYRHYENADICTDINYKNIYFIDNNARQTGHDLYGGLLDRCIVSPYAELIQVGRYTSLTGKSYLQNISDISLSTTSNAVASDAVRVCFCKGNKPDCSYHPSIKAWKGKTSTLSAITFDQIEHPVKSTTRSYLSWGSTNVGPSIQETNTNCTDLAYNILSLLQSDKVYLYADGPCDYAGISKQYFNITFLPCPIGFREEQEEKYRADNCECDSRLTRYINCSVENGTVQRITNSWIMYSSNTNEFITYEYCPYDFCYPPSESIIDFSVSDSLCAFNRTGKLCGSCGNGLSLTLGSSKCKSCSHYWLFLLIPFALGGIVLVAFLLLCNLTTAVGTINGLIFYANVVVASPATFFPYKPPFFSEILSWINLDLGIETCFFNGMDAYMYTWLQLAFPVYIIFLVIIVIVISEYSRQFAKLLSTRNPIATLATLILLSYAKLLRTVIDISLFAELEYINNNLTDKEIYNSTAEMVWLFDGNVPYLKDEHLYLFIAAVIIMVLVLGYTILLFAWQWIGNAPNWKIFNWTRNVKLISFMETYHAPFKPKHRYWAGVLLIARIVLYAIMAFNFHGDINSNLLAIIVVSFFLVALGKGVYKNWIIGTFEMIFLINLGVFAACTSYVKNINANQTAVSYISTVASFVLLCAILAYHTYAFILKKTLLPLCQTNKVNYNILEDSNDFVHDREPNVNDNFREPLNLITEHPNTEDYRQAAVSRSQCPNPVVTQAVIEGRPRGELLNSQLIQPVRNVEEQNQ